MRAWLRTDLRIAVATMLAALLALGTTLLIDPEVGPAVLAVVLSISLARSQLERDLRGRLEAGALLPLLGLATAGVALLLRETPWVGAAVFVVGLSGSILLRLPGGVWRRASRLVALPFTALLVAPGIHSERFGPAGALLVPLLVGIVAWGWVTVVQLGARRLGLLPDAVPAPAAPATPPAPPSESTPPPRGGLRPSATVRFAIQLAVALSAAFLVGFLLFPERWQWIVLTTTIVSVGQRGRADALHKAVHRIVGSAAGTVVSLLPIAAIDRAPGLAILVALLAVFVGLLFRDRGYAWWGFGVTVALAIVQTLGGAARPVLPLRLEEILIGAAIGVLPAFVLLPVRSADTARSRIRGVLAALQDQLAAPTTESTARLDAALVELRLATAPFAELSRLSRGRAGGTARWVALTERAAALGRDGGSGEARRALGDARRALREPAQLTSALERLTDSLNRCPPPSSSP